MEWTRDMDLRLYHPLLCSKFILLGYVNIVIKNIDFLGTDKGVQNMYSGMITFIPLFIPVGGAASCYLKPHGLWNSI